MVDWEKESERSRKRRQKELKADEENHQEQSEDEVKNNAEGTSADQTENSSNHEGIDSGSKLSSRHQSWTAKSLGRKEKSQKTSEPTEKQEVLPDPEPVLESAKVKKSQSKRTILMVVLLTALFVLAAASSLYLLSPSSRIQSVEVSGNETVTTEDILDYAGLYPKMYWPGVSHHQSEVNRRLTSYFPEIRQAKLVRGDHHVVTITIQEYRIVGYIEQDGLYYPVQENQKVLDDGDSEMNGEAPLLSGFSDEEVSTMASQLAKIPEDILQQVSEVDRLEDEESEGKIALKMKDGNIVVGFMSTIGDRMAYYNSIVNQLNGKKGLIDMEVGIYYSELTPLNDPFASQEDVESYKRTHSTGRSSGSYGVSSSQASRSSGTLSSSQSSTGSGYGSYSGTGSQNSQVYGQGGTTSPSVSSYGY